jgi:hypothetical protein
MRKSNDPALRDYGEYIASALLTEGGHLSIGRGGFTLYYARGARLSGYDCDEVKTCCIAAGLPVIDSRMVAFEDVVRLAVRGPMVAVGEEASPPPLSRALLCSACVDRGGLCRGRRRNLQYFAVRSPDGDRRVRGRRAGP